MYILLRGNEKMSNRQNGQALRRYMKARGMKKQRELARDLKLSDAMISRYFSGEKSFSARTALRVSHQTGIPMEELFR
jgi:transcriptional regulator with XRE-family HTH domain